MEEGGMALPNFKDYFYAAKSKSIINLCKPTFQVRWKSIELSIMNDPPIHAVLAHKIIGRYIDNQHNSYIKAQLKTWKLMKDEYKLGDKLLILQWVAYDPEFKPNRMDYRFKSWISKGITTL